MEAHLVDTYVFKHNCNPKFQADSIRECYNPKDDSVTFAMVSEYFSKPNVLAEIDKKRMYLPDFRTERHIFADAVELQNNAKSEVTKGRMIEMQMKSKGMLIDKVESSSLTLYALRIESA